MTPQGTGRQDASAERRPGVDRQDALALLRQDHRDVEALFKHYKTAGEPSEKSALARRICLLLKAHARVEEEIFYPAARRRIEDKELVDEALTEHRSIKELIEQIEGCEAGDTMIDARLQVLSERVEMHVREEESELFPEVQNAEIDLMGLGARLADLKQQVMRELGAETPGRESRSFER